MKFLTPSLLLLLSATTFLKAEDSMANAKVFPLVLLQTISSEAIPHHYSINGFSTATFASMGSTDRHVPGFKTDMDEYSVIHPYFLRSGLNSFEATYHLDLSYMLDSDAGPWTFSTRIATFRYDPKSAEYDSAYTEKVLLGLSSPALRKTADAEQVKTLSGTFELKQPLPNWGWTHGNKIEDSAEQRASLYHEYGSFRERLVALRTAFLSPDHNQDASQSFVSDTRQSMAEFITASELRNVRYTFLDELVYASAHLSTKEFDDEQARKAALPPKPQKSGPILPPVVVHDGPVVDSAPLGPDGKMPARLYLMELPAADHLIMDIFAGGTLARLTDSDGKPLIVYRSNYNDGPWGRAGTEKLTADVWFRRTADGHWAVDGISSMRMASVQLTGGAIGELLELSHF